jgi:MerR family transcriptional regulator/heat shock protein HspR
MRSRMEQIEAEVNAFLDYVRQEFFQGQDEEFEARRNAIVRVKPAGVIKVEERDH